MHALLLLVLLVQTPDRQPIPVLLPDPVGVVVFTDQPTLVLGRCEAYRRYEALVAQEQAKAPFTQENVRLYSALRKALFTFSSVTRPEAPNGGVSQGDISGCTSPTVLVP